MFPIVATIPEFYKKVFPEGAYYVKDKDCYYSFNYNDCCKQPVLVGRYCSYDGKMYLKQIVKHHMYMFKLRTALRSRGSDRYSRHETAFTPLLYWHYDKKIIKYDDISVLLLTDNNL